MAASATFDVLQTQMDQSDLSSLFALCPTMLCIAGADSCFERVNPAFEQVLGFSWQELTACPFLDFVHGDDVAETIAAVNTLARGDNVCDFENRYRCRDGSYRRLRWMASPGPEGRIFAAAVDVTDLRAAEASNVRNQAEQLASRRIQQHMLPEHRPALAGYDIAGTSCSAELTGGDLFDFIWFADGSLGVVVGDVAGHGIASALTMASTHAYLRALATGTTDVREILIRTNTLIAQETEDTQFVTLLLARLQPVGHMLTYSSAGHPTAYLLDDSGAVKQLLSSTSMPLGIAEDAEFSAATPLEMAVGDRLLLFTDGALDASAPDGAHFGIGRVMALVCQNLHCSSTDLVEIICQAVNHFSHGDPRKDDVTIVIMRRETPG